MRGGRRCHCNCCTHAAVLRWGSIAIYAKGLIKACGCDSFVGMSSPMASQSKSTTTIRAFGFGTSRDCRVIQAERERALCHLQGQMVQEQNKKILGRRSGFVDDSAGGWKNQCRDRRCATRAASQKGSSRVLRKVLESIRNVPTGDDPPDPDYVELGQVVMVKRRVRRANVGWSQAPVGNARGSGV